MPRKAGSTNKRASAKRKGGRGPLKAGTVETVETDSSTLLTRENDKGATRWMKWFDEIVRTRPHSEISDIVEELKVAEEEYSGLCCIDDTREKLIHLPRPDDAPPKWLPGTQPGGQVIPPVTNIVDKPKTVVVSVDTKEETKALDGKLKKKKRGRPKKTEIKSEPSTHSAAPAPSESDREAKKAKTTVKEEPTAGAHLVYDTLGPVGVIDTSARDGVKGEGVASDQQPQPVPPGAVSRQVTKPSTTTVTAGNIQRRPAKASGGAPLISTLPPGLLPHATSPALAYAFLLHQAAQQQQQQNARAKAASVAQSQPPNMASSSKAPAPTPSGTGTPQQNAALIEQLKTLVAARQATAWRGQNVAQNIQSNGSRPSGAPGGEGAAKPAVANTVLNGRQTNAVAGSRTQGLLAPKIDRLSGATVSPKSTAIRPDDLGRAPVPVIPPGAKATPPKEKGENG